MRSTLPGQKAAALLVASVKSMVRWRMYWRSVRFSTTRVCKMPFASAASVPGVNCRCRSARCAVAVVRGSTTINFPPADCC